MTLFEDIKKYLPQYLSPEAQSSLFDELKNFPNNINEKLYGRAFCEGNFIYQGDGLQELLISNLPSNDTKARPALILSNTCDVSSENERKFGVPRLMYCPIMPLKRYVSWVGESRKLLSGDALESHLNAIKNQTITTLLYLPQGEGLTEDHIAFLDQINNCDLNYIKPESVNDRRLFSLSNYGFYLFLFKISIHFTRVFEAVDRG